jgi:hypothetical protein
MHKIGECFVRMAEGEWFCRAPCEIDGPAGSVSVTPGVVYRRGRAHLSLDVAAVLDDWQETGELPPNISIR